MPARFDVIVIGAGPTGSTAANLLAQHGLSVVCFEREEFPRFHVGESLLPVDLALFARLGVDPDAAGYLYKAGAEFIDESVGGHANYPFSGGLDGTADHAYQVERSIFDHWLAARAEALGAELHYGERVVAVEIGPDAVSCTTTRGTYEGRFVIDATGLDAFFGRRARSVDTIIDFGLAATFTHVFDLDPGVDRALTEEARGNVKIFFADAGWCWVIPLGNRKLSMGMVSRRKGLTPDWLDEAIERSPMLTGLTRGAHRPKRPGMLGSFSFYNTQHHGPRWSCLGDASCFLDPIFSSGVSLGMLGAEHLVDTLAPALRAGEEGRPDLLDAHQQYMGHGYNVFSTLINSFYHSTLLRDLFFSERDSQDEMLRRGLTTVLAGDVWRGDNPFQQKLMASRRREKLVVARTSLAPTF